MNIDADARDPALFAAHLRLLARRPFLQRLPYRDHQLAVALIGVGAHNEPVLAVRFRGTIRAARRAMWQALAAAHDPGTEYRLQYTSLPR